MGLKIKAQKYSKIALAPKICTFDTNLGSPLGPGSPSPNSTLLDSLQTLQWPLYDKEVPLDKKFCHTPKYNV